MTCWLHSTAERHMLCTHVWQSMVAAGTQENERLVHMCMNPMTAAACIMTFLTLKVTFGCLLLPLHGRWNHW